MVRENLSTTSPSISVVLCTRNRPADLRRCLASLATVKYPQWEIVIVDQSDESATKDVIDAFSVSLPPLTYRHIPEKGLSRARNIGMGAARGGVIAFLDDDCTVPEDWLIEVGDAFRRHPHAALIFGSFRAVTHDEGRFLIPSYTPATERTLHGHRAQVDPGGYGGSMYVRRGASRRIGPFDVHLGAGSRFPSGEDRDYSMRALSLGYDVIETPRIVVDHHGARDRGNGEVKKLFRDNVYSQGALHMKLLRAGDAFALWVIAVYAWRCVAKTNWRNLLLLRRPLYLRDAANYAQGLAASFALKVDRRARLYAGR